MRSILLLDEDQAFGHALVKTLDPRDWRLTWIADGHEGVAILRRQNIHQVLLEPGLSSHLWYSLLADVMLAAHLRPVHVVTAFASSAMSRRAADLAVTSFFVKPIVVEQAVQALSTQFAQWSELEKAETLSAVEWEHVNDVIYACEGNVSLAARRLGIPRQTLYRKLRKHSPLRRTSGCHVRGDSIFDELANITPWS